MRSGRHAVTLDNGMSYVYTHRHLIVKKLAMRAGAGVLAANHTSANRT